MRPTATPTAPASTHHRVIADHLRSTSFLIADGVLPSNEGRGYVLRRIMRRAMRHAHLLGAQDPVMYRLVPALVAQMGAAFPELDRAQPLIEETLQLGGNPVQDDARPRPEAARRRTRPPARGRALPGEAAFRLYDTYGFPLDLTQDALREQGRRSTSPASRPRWPSRKAKARAAWAGSGEAADEAIWFDLAEQHGATEFLGYDTETAEGAGPGAGRRRRSRSTPPIGADVQVVLNQTPFYAESGGQVGDTGTLRYRRRPRRASPTSARRPASSSTTAGSRRASSRAAPRRS